MNEYEKRIIYTIAWAIFGFFILFILGIFTLAGADKALVELYSLPFVLLWGGLGVWNFIIIIRCMNECIEAE